MAGIVAMASIIEDFETQPCKKPHKDVDTPTVKTITNYFSPLPKPMAKPFSPPRCNNIMDYFSRKSPPSREQKITPEQTKESCQAVLPTEDHASKEKVAKLPGKPPQRRRKKPSKAARRLHQESETDDLVDEADQTLCDVSMEVNVNEASQLNCSTVVVSFKDFVQSQGTISKEEDKAGGQDGVKEPSEMGTEQLDMLNANKVGDPSELQRVSPRTLTIQAEVHAIVNPASSRPVRKMASIFSGRKEQQSAADFKMESSPQTQLRPELYPTKRKSNVVLQEEDMELNVVESKLMPKCNQSERNQFMSAFKQPAPDKPKPGKSQAKSKQAADDALDEAEKLAAQEETIHEEKAGLGKNGAKRKPARRRKKNTLEEVQLQPVVVSAAFPTQQQEDSASELVVEPISYCSATTPTSTTSVGRSEGEARHRPAAVTETAMLVSKSRRREESKVAETQQNSPLQVSTPKTQRAKHGIFKALMITTPDEKCSPIRMKFSRVIQNISLLPEDQSNFEILSPLAFKPSRGSKKKKQAKKLVEKARAIQQKREAAAAEDEAPSVRRSSRSHAAKKSYGDTDDSVVCVEDDQTGSAETGEEKGKAKKRLRSLNDVLGRNAAVNKESKTSTSSKEKKASRTSAFSIVDESSGDGTENSQDNGRFQARRDFLNSGLPESFKKQIAKSLTTKESSSSSCSYFQPALHVQQMPQDCPLWSLQWPQCPLLHGLKGLCSLPSNTLPSLSGSFFSKTEASSRVVCQRGSGLREELSEWVRQLLTEEVSASNPSFPVQRFLSSFLKRRAETQQQVSTSEPESVTQSPSVPSLAEPVRGKRKRVDGDEKKGKVAKKLRAHRSDVEIRLGGDNSLTPDPEPPRRGSRVSRAQRRKREEEAQEEGVMEKEKADPSLGTTPGPCQNDVVIVLDDSPLSNSLVKEDAVSEDVLWTEKYQPQHSTDVFGNTASVRKLHSWLKEWKLRADREERKKQKEKKPEEGDSDPDWDCGEDPSQGGMDLVCNTLLITGPAGVGKTAAVYACAQELGFKVFEVNASSQRSGRQILSQLREATQSHQVDIQGVNVHKPCYFNSHGSGGASSARSGPSPRKVNSPRRVVSSPRKPPQSPHSARKGCLAPSSLANFFKVGRPTSKELTGTDMTPPTATLKKAVTAKEDVRSGPKQPPVQTAACPPNEPPAGEEESKKTATSLILFEEVDVIFDDDAGFLAAVKTFMATTKRPVILTTSDPSFRAAFDGYFEEIRFTNPSVENACSFLQLLCLAENTRTDPRDLSSLLSLTRCDIRQSLLQLQFWTCSARGRYTCKPLSKAGGETAREVELKAERACEAADVSVCEVTAPDPVPSCDAGCAEYMLGLSRVEPERDIPDLLKGFLLPGEPGLWEMLTDSWRRGTGLFYSNLELLLPLPLTVLTVPAHRPLQSLPNTTSKDQPSAEPPEAPGPNPDALPPQQSAVKDSNICSPVKVSNRRGRRKKQHRMEDSSDSDSEERFLSLCKQGNKPTDNSEAQNQGQDFDSLGRDKVDVDPPPVQVKIKRVPLTPEERMKSVPVSQCLASLADFLDNMSFLDSSMRLPTSPVVGHLHKQTPSLSSRAVVKDGMADEPREQCAGGGWAETERAVEIQAALEAMSFHKCRSGVAEAWEKAQALEGELGNEAAAELTLPVAPHRRGFKLTQDNLCKPEVLQCRSEVTVALLSSGVFGHQGQRQAVALDYMPALRAICRSELLKEQGKLKRRFHHYLNAIHLDLPKSTLQHLAEDFPQSTANPCVLKDQQKPS